jgi:hypothetical protein
MSYQERMSGVKYTIIEYIKKRLNNTSDLVDDMNGGATAYWLEELDKNNDDTFNNMFLLNVI